MAAVNPFDASLLGTHVISLRQELAPEIRSHCFNNLLGVLHDSTYFSLWECLLSKMYQESNPPACAAAWVLDYVRRPGDNPTPSHFNNAATLLNAIYGRNRANTALSNTFMALLASVERLFPQDPDAIALRATINAFPNPIRTQDLRLLDQNFTNLFNFSHVDWRNIYNGFSQRAARCCMIAGIASLCHRGTMTEAHITKIARGTEEVGRVEEVLRPEYAVAIYRILRAHFPRPCNMTDLFGRLRETFTQETNLRLSLIIDQAQRAGVASVNITMAALKLSADCGVWGYIARHAPQEYAAFIAAVQTVAANPYVGFDLTGNIPDAIKSTRYPAMIAAGMEVLRSLNPNDTSTRYRGRIQTPMRTDLNMIIAQWTAARLAAHNPADYEVNGQYAVDIRAAINANANVWDQF